MNNAFIAVIAFIALVVHASAAEQAPTEQIGAWSLLRQVDVMDDTTSVHVTAYGKDSALAKEVSLTLSCARSTTVAMIDFRTFMGRKDIEVTYRVDDKPSFNQAFTARQNMAYMIDETGMLIFVLSLKQGKRLLLRAQPVSGLPVTAQFDLTGFTEAIKPVEAMCKG